MIVQRFVEQHDITADEKFDIICRILDINQEEMIQSIISEIKNLYDYAQDRYMNESVLFLDEIENETYNNVKMSHLEEYNDGRIGDFDAMDFDCEYLDLDTDKMNFIKIAIQCGLTELQYGKWVIT